MNSDIIVYRNLSLSSLNPSMLHTFDRYQTVNRAWRMVDGKRVLVSSPCVDDWNIPTKELVVTKYFRGIIKEGGVVTCAFRGDCIVGFAALLYPPCGSRGQYADLVMLHVSRESRGSGFGKWLFHRAADRARRWGRQALHISAHSAEETQAFYRLVGCVDAHEILTSHTEQEPYDIQMEYLL